MLLKLDHILAKVLSLFSTMATIMRHIRMRVNLLAVRSKLLTGDMAGKYVVFVGSLRIKATWANAIQVDKVIAHSKMRLVEPWYERCMPIICYLKCL